jgi:hypothetical protein
MENGNSNNEQPISSDDEECVDNIDDRIDNVNV